MESYSADLTAFSSTLASTGQHPWCLPLATVGHPSDPLLSDKIIDPTFQIEASDLQKARASTELRVVAI
ncbi:hypothetical protein N7456_013300 [Penicillium angulare]|uniref:Uncharacterized protein n=1 Tax=Penicillium angulare TaxID=116970 RepID=A0A9W9JTT4_9EURO|nr:hypothetical protein N7456_013300 [Penicillium angulare]